MAVAAALAMLQCPIPAGAAGGNPEVLATVAGEAVTVAEFQEILAAYRSSGDLGRMSKSMAAEGQEEILQELIDTRLMAKAARERKLEADPRVKRRIDSAVDSVLLQSLVEKEIAALDRSEGRLKEYYQSHKGDFRDSAKVKARHIVVASREEAEAVQRKLKEGADFAALASTLNIDDTKGISGDLGWVPRGYMVKQFESALFALGQGQISDIVKTRFGYHIVRAEELAGEKLQPFTQVKELIARKISEQRLNELREELRKTARITVDRDMLKRMIKE